MRLMIKSPNVDLQISVPKPSCVTGKHVLDDLLVYYEMSFDM
jgi:hypothetical protein